MRQIAKRGLVTAMATGGMLAMASGYVHADSGADAAVANSPGVLSGNAVQVPVEVDANVCNLSVNVIAALNPAAGNVCLNDSSEGASQGNGHGPGHHGGKPGDHGRPGHPGGHTPGHGHPGIPGVPGTGIPGMPGTPHTPGGDTGTGHQPPSNGGHQGGHQGGQPGGSDHQTPPGSNPGSTNPSGGSNTSNQPGVDTRGDQPGSAGQDGHATVDQPGAGRQDVPGGAAGQQTSPAGQKAGELAETGGPGSLGITIPLSAGTLLGGVILYRRSRRMVRG